ncbi:MAG: hypothetical protein EOM66_11275 [Clostridia bacterium]|nr:hypothetical protein [Clostridia bacterium]
MSSAILKAEQLRRAIQMALQGLTDEATIMEVPYIYAVWNGNGCAYRTGEILQFGVNGVGDPQLYQVLQNHTSQTDWQPDTATSLYKAIGISPSGHPLWSQPVGASDAYGAGDIVEHNGALWVSDIDANVWEPGVYGWTVYEG